MIFCWYKFEDGYRVCVAGFSRNELAWEKLRHGKLVSVTPA